MKKTMLIGVFSVFAMSSCMKDYVCKCSDPTGSGQKHIDLQAKNDDAAATLCAAEEGQAYGYEFTCAIQ